MRRGAAALALAAAALSTPAQAQGWNVDVGAGHATHDPVAARVATLSASAGVRYGAVDGTRWLYLSAGAPLRAGGPGWGVGGGGVELPVAERGALRLGVRAEVDAYGYGPTDSLRAGGGATVAAAPTLALARGPVRADLYAGALVAAERLDGRTPDPRRFGDAGARVAWNAAPGVELSAEGRWLREAGGDDSSFGGAGAQLRREWGSAWAFGGGWLADTGTRPDAALGAGASLRVGRRSEVSVGWQQSPSDPVYRTAPRRTWSVQLSRALGRLPRREAPGERLVPRLEGGRVVLSLPAAGLDTAPAVVGDFTAWQPVPMTRQGGFWMVSLAIAPGTYHYGFRSAAGEWLVPVSLPQVDDGMGGTSAVLVVP